MSETVGGGPPKFKVYQCGDTILDKEEVEKRLRVAQEAVLYPNRYALDEQAQYIVRRPGESIHGSAGDTVSFSGNSVIVQISGPDVTDLSFCDLPGIIATAGEDGNESDIEFVQNMVSAYIKRSTCIILLTITCETDFENQGAYQLARKYDPKGNRTIGVLTKPDRIEQGQEHKWLNLLQGVSRNKLSKGWFCVKQPSPTELDEKLTWSEARQREEEFFNTQTPWSSQSREVRSCFGVGRLTSRLTEILYSLVATSLPSLKNEIQTLSEATVRSLRSLPPEVSGDPTATVLHLILDFCREISVQAAGVPDGDGLIQQLRSAQNNFQHAIKASAPDFRPFNHADDETEGSIQQPVPLTGDVGDVYKQYDAHKRGNGLVSELKSPWILYWDDVSKICSEWVIHLASTIELTVIVRAVTRELPNNVPFVVKRKLIKRFVEQWEAPTNELLDEVETIVCAYIQKFVNKFFEQHIFGGLHSAVREAVVDRTKQCRKQSDDQTRFLLNLENKQTFTINTQTFTKQKNSFLQYYTSVHETHNQDGPAERLLQDVIGVMAEVRAYYEVAHQRFTDIVPMAIDDIMVTGLVDGLEKYLLENLGITGDNARKTCAGFLADSPETTREREVLKARLDRLNSARRELASVWS
ncbi:dynamin central region protein [Ceratobasidium sp. AG-Ba]|nr:dynamin central region protein [Ceratobasidium sp. AG-Ba]QRW12137.1 dynamin central region protein [Ceratobasidium sp. AG-Ba]